MKKLIKLKQLNPDQRLFLLFLSTFFGLLLIPNNKLYILLFLFIGIILFFYFKKSLWETIFLVLLLSIPFENTLREWIFYSSNYNSIGYSFFFGITIKSILSLTIILLTFFKKNKNSTKNKNYSLKNKYLLIFYLLALTTSAFFQTRLSTVSIGVIRLSLSICFYFLASDYFSSKNKKNIFKYYVLSLIIFSSFIGLLQFIKQKPLGKFIELTPGFSTETGYSTTDGEKQYRVSGFISHPVYFGSFMSILIPILIAFFLKSKNKRTRTIYLIITIVSIVVLLATLSRSTWINLAIIITFFYFYIKKNKLLLSYFKISQKAKKIFFFLAFLSIVFITPIIFTRIKSIPDLFNNKDGSLYSRLSLLNTSIQMIKLKPLTGIGLNNFSFENYNKDSSIFIAPPHNTLFIFFSELGIPTTIFFILFIYLSLKPKKPFFKKETITFGVWVGLLTFIISSQFHPLFNLDPTFDMFMLILGYYSTC